MTDEEIRRKEFIERAIESKVADYYDVDVVNIMRTTYRDFYSIVQLSFEVKDTSIDTFILLRDDLNQETYDSETSVHFELDETIIVAMYPPNYVIVILTLTDLETANDFVDAATGHVENN